MNKKNNNSFFKKRYLVAVICFILLIMIALVISALRWEPKPDPVSEIVIRHAASIQLQIDNDIEKDPNDLTEEDFAKLIKLKINDLLDSAGNIHWLSWQKKRLFTELKKRELYDIKLLEKFTNLQELQMEDIEYPQDKIPKWTEFLGKLGVFDFKDRYTIDLSPIKNLSALKKLSMRHTQISDITPLKNLENLEELVIDVTPVSNLEPLRGLKNLQFLSICKTEVSDLEPIMHLEKLQRLIVINCPNITEEELIESKAVHPDIVIQRHYGP